MFKLITIINHDDRIQVSLEAGYLSPEEAVALRNSMARSYVSQRGWQLADADPQQALGTPQDLGAVPRDFSIGRSAKRGDLRPDL